MYMCIWNDILLNACVLSVKNERHSISKKIIPGIKKVLKIHSKKGLERFPEKDLNV